MSFLEGNEPEGNLFGWIETQPELDQPDILRELKFVLDENFDTKPGLDRNKMMAILDEKIQTFEEAILSRKLHKSLFMMETEEKITDEETFKYFLDYTRQEIITRIVSVPENQENWSFVHKVIQIEKDSGFYNPDNWKAIF
jgi:hypothetical protein